ncbi:bifunctional folylpolyglutamate synthase/dihydrofolate synthase [Congregibacter litoralis]|uniref:Dihydrofolate synthase/folylpolyglutamate synthase n=1 Tax=Congregibacter litoralis KT71 TaxID=314285 RepID=A4A847_9GAMM|nr:folylpolyglutamate synthase/dihydrofolate synthase family protein [Congregibacter litoralis]EAQ97842.1 folylpolyglutamate synthase/dihydrofolate synthase [Congregibacter litoralis KT71]
MPERSLGEWLRYLEQLHPVDIDLGLARVRKAAEQLALFPYGPEVITVAGTNGKGSVVFGTECILRAHGRRTGRYTSPHLLSFNERIAVDGCPVSDGQIVAAFDAIEAARGDVTLTYFEFATLAAYWIFRELRVDVAVMEVGLGGRLDAVNLVDSDIAVITAIDLDHQHWLGDTVEQIAPEKAAIARPGRPVVLAEADYPDTLFHTLDDIGAVPLRAGREWSWRYEGDLQLSLKDHRESITVPLPDGLRPSNLGAALQASAVSLGQTFDPQKSREALRTLSVPARRQTISFAGRALLLDVAHNPAAMVALVEHLKARPVPGKTFAALGLMKDKDLAGMAASLATAVDGACALAIPGIDRAAAPEAVWQALDDVGIAIPQGEFTADAVWSQLLDGSAAGDRLVICGSFYSVAGIMELLNIELPSTPSVSS